jgi:hypothetical protein
MNLALIPLIIGVIAFVFGIGFALRERAWRKKYGRYFNQK